MRRNNGDEGARRERHKGDHLYSRQTGVRGWEMEETGQSGKTGGPVRRGGCTGIGNCSGAFARMKDSCMCFFQREDGCHAAVCHSSFPVFIVLRFLILYAESIRNRLSCRSGACRSDSMFHALHFCAIIQMSIETIRRKLWDCLTKRHALSAAANRE